MRPAQQCRCNGSQLRLATPTLWERGETPAQAGYVARRRVSTRAFSTFGTIHVIFIRLLPARDSSRRAKPRSSAGGRDRLFQQQDGEGGQQAVGPERTTAP